METKIVIVVEKARAGEKSGYKAHFQGRPEFYTFSAFRNQSVFELIRDYGERVGIELRGGGA